MGLSIQISTVVVIFWYLLDEHSQGPVGQNKLSFNASMQAKECFLEKMESMDLTMLTCLNTPQRFVLKALEDPRVRNLKIDLDLLEAGFTPRSQWQDVMGATGSKTSKLFEELMEYSNEFYGNSGSWKCTEVMCFKILWRNISGIFNLWLLSYWKPWEWWDALWGFCHLLCGFHLEEVPARAAGTKTFSIDSTHFFNGTSQVFFFFFFLRWVFWTVLDCFGLFWTVLDCWTDMNIVASGCYSYF